MMDFLFNPWVITIVIVCVFVAILLHLSTPRR